MQEVGRFCNYLKRFFLHAYFELQHFWNFLEKIIEKNMNVSWKTIFRTFLKVANVMHYVKYYFPLYYKLVKLLILFSH